VTPACNPPKPPRGKYPPLPPGYSPELRSLVASLLRQSARARPGVEAVLRLQYVRAHMARYARHVDR
jgi:hypothetical protein